MHARGFTAAQKTVENQDRAPGQSWATGRWAVAGRGPRAAGPSDRRAAGLFFAKSPKTGHIDFLKPVLVREALLCL